MTIGALALISLAVSLDAFGVAIAIGLNNGAKINQKLLYAISFGFFQFLFSFLGGLGGKIFTEVVASVPSLIGGIIIAIIGIMMIKEGRSENNNNLILSPKMYLILGISVSIDASVVGFVAFSSISTTSILTRIAVIVGMVTFLMSIAAFIIAKLLNKMDIIKSYADYIGGVILILFGIKMILF